MHADDRGALLAIAGLFGLLRQRVVANAAVLALLLFGLFFYEAVPLVGIAEKWSGPALYFLIGVFLYINREYVPLERGLFLFAVVAGGAAPARKPDSLLRGICSE